MVTSLLTILLCTPVAFFASYGRGYLPPIGFAILTLIIAQFTGLVGLGPYFPWGIPLLFTTAAGAESAQLGRYQLYHSFFNQYVRINRHVGMVAVCGSMLMYSTSLVRTSPEEIPSFTLMDIRNQDPIKFMSEPIRRFPGHR